jgi:flagellar biogenesis protein FliO
MPSLTMYIVQTVVTLLAVVVLAVGILYAARRLGVGRALGPVRLVGRLPLDARRSVYLVRVGPKLYVLGASEAGVTKLGELPGDSVELPDPALEPGSFAEVLSRALRRRSPEKPDDTA